MPKQNQSKRIIVLCTIIFLIVSILFGNAETVKYRLKIDKNGYPIITIANPYGKNVIIKAISKEEGSIGFSQNGIITWIKGKPEIEKLDDKTSYRWVLENNKVFNMKVIPKINEIIFQFKLLENKNPERTKWYLNFAAYNKEYFTGVMERVVDGHQKLSWADGIKTALNLHGEKVEVKLKPTVSAYAPFFISSRYYGFFAMTTWPGNIDFCNENMKMVKMDFEGPELNFKIYIGDPLSVVKRHALETGPSFVPPKWAFGPWRWRDEHKNLPKYYDSTEAKTPYNTQLVEDILMMEALDIPLTAYWVDRPWAKGPRGFDDYEWDTERFPKPQEMIKWLENKNIKFMLWIGPFVMGEMAEYAEKMGYHLESKPRTKAKQVLIDFTNPDARKWWGENGPAKMAKMGVKGFKLDRADGEKLMDNLNLKTYDGRTYRENYNDYPVQYVRATHEAVQDVLGNDFILFPRAQFTGSARHGGLWAGDTNGKPEGLRSVIIGVQRCAVMGYPIWGSDTGGYWGEFSRETCMRWLGFSCFSPIMEVGPTYNKGLWDSPNEPHYDTELLATWRLYSKIRMKLIDYIHNLAKEASETGTPIVRPLFLIYPEQKEAWKDWQTYLFGPDILVSIIWETGKEKHRLYLPKGEEWIDAWDTSKVYNGGKYIEVESPVYKIPIFIRKGSKIDLGDLNALYKESLKIVSNKPNLTELEKKEGWR